MNIDTFDDRSGFWHANNRQVADTFAQDWMGDEILFNTLLRFSIYSFRQFAYVRRI